MSHLKRHEQKYKQFWDGKSLTAEEGPCPSWTAYIEALAKSGAWGGYLEVAALAATTATRINVFHEDGQCNTFNMEGVATINLYYHQRHYEWAKGQLKSDVVHVDWKTLKDKSYRGAGPASRTRRR